VGVYTALDCEFGLVSVAWRLAVSVGVEINVVDPEVVAHSMARSDRVDAQRDGHCDGEGDSQAGEVVRHG
jgi:hypothetical protein